MAGRGALTRLRPGRSADPPPPPARARLRHRLEGGATTSELTPGDRVAKALLGVAALLPTGALVYLGYQMARQAYPAIVFNGTSFFTTKLFTLGNLYSTTLEKHNGYVAPAAAHYGIAPLLFGTLVSSLIALAIAVPVSVGGAIFLAERVPARLQGTLGIFLQLLAGIPSIVLGLWGVYTFGPFMARTLYRWIADLHIPWLRGSTGAGEGLLTAALVLAVMIIPIISSITRELVRSVPPISKEGALALGLTRSEAIRVVTIPFIRRGIVAAAILGWARALGETMAVLVISGDFLNGYPKSVFDSFYTMAAAIAGFIDGALTDTTGMALHALAELGLVLLAVSLLTNLGGRLITRGMSDAGLPVGRGV